MEEVGEGKSLMEIIDRNVSKYQETGLMKSDLTKQVAYRIVVSIDKKSES